MNGRALLSLLSDRPVAYHPDIARIVGGVKAAVFLCQLLYWTGKGKRLDGYIWKVQSEWEEETALTRYEQEGARKKLKELGILKEKLRGVPAKLHYKVDTDHLLELIDSFYNKPADKVAENPQTEIAENQQTITEITQENTTHVADATREPPPPSSAAVVLPQSEDTDPLGDLGTEWHKQNDTSSADTPHYGTRLRDPCTHWGMESAEMQRQLTRYGERGRTVQRIGYELERQFGMRPLWSDPKAVKGWMSGISTLLQEAGGNEELIIQAKRELTEAELDAPNPYSLRKKAMSLAEKQRRPGNNGGAPAPYSNEWYKARMENDPQYQAFAEVGGG